LSIKCRDTEVASAHLGSVEWANSVVETPITQTLLLQIEEMIIWAVAGTGDLQLNMSS